MSRFESGDQSIAGHRTAYLRGIFSAVRFQPAAVEDCAVEALRRWGKITVVDHESSPTPRSTSTRGRNTKAPAPGSPTRPAECPFVNLPEASVGDVTGCNGCKDAELHLAPSGSNRAVPVLEMDTQRLSSSGKLRRDSGGQRPAGRRQGRSRCRSQSSSGRGC